MSRLNKVEQRHAAETSGRRGPADPREKSVEEDSNRFRQRENGSRPTTVASSEAPMRIRSVKCGSVLREPTRGVRNGGGYRGPFVLQFVSSLPHRPQYPLRQN